MRFALLLTAFAALAVAFPTPGNEDALAARSGLPSEIVTQLAPSLFDAPQNETLGHLNARTIEVATLKAHPHPHNADLEVEERITASGKKYRTIRPKGSAEAEALEAKQLATRNPPAHFWEPLDPVWSPNNGARMLDYWAHTYGIDSWSIDFGGIFYKWRLNFWVESGFQYNYGFRDIEGEWYWCKVYLAGHHYIDYNSDNAGMNAIQGD